MPHAIVSNLAKRRERRFDSYGTELRLGLERLEKLRGTHGFSKAEDAVRMLMAIKPFEPAADVVTLE